MNHLHLPNYRSDHSNVIQKDLFRITESSGLFTATIVARDTNGVSAVWEFKQFVKHTTGGGIVFLGSQDSYVAKDAGASSWDADITSIGDRVIVEVQGNIANTIDWKFDVILFKSGD